MPRLHPALAILTALVITTATMRAAVDAWLGAAQPVAAPIAWQPQVSGVTVRLRGVSAVSADVAWASGGAGTVLRTTDGGRTWARRAVPGAEALDFRDVDASDADTRGRAQHRPGRRLADLPDRRRRRDLDRTLPQRRSRGVLRRHRLRRRQPRRRGQRFGGRPLRHPPDRRRRPDLDAGAGRSPAAGPARRGRLRGQRHQRDDGRPRPPLDRTTAARVLRSSDGGRSWSVHQTPLATGEATGIFSIAFRDDRHGVVVGGNYQRESEAVDNAATTSDGGVTWTRVAAPGLSGFRSAVAWLPTAGTAAAGGRPGRRRLVDRPGPHLAGGRRRGLRRGQYRAARRRRLGHRFRRSRRAADVQRALIRIW